MSTIDKLQMQRNRLALRPEDTERTNGFVCNVRFGNDLPSVPFDPKFLKYPFPQDRFIKFQPTSLDRLQKAVFHVEKDIGVPINLFEALRNVQYATSGTTVTQAEGDKGLQKPDDWDGKKDWDKLSLEEKEMELLEKADLELVEASKKKVTASSGKDNGGRGMSFGYFARKTASRSKHGAQEGLTQKTWMVKTKYLDNSFETSVSSVVNKGREEKIIAEERARKYATFVKKREDAQLVPAVERIQQEFVAVSNMTTDSLLENEKFQLAYKKKLDMGLRPVGVYAFLPDTTNIWTDDHILIDFARKPM